MSTKANLSLLFAVLVSAQLLLVGSNALAATGNSGGAAAGGLSFPPGTPISTILAA
jgi:hypothetical protein